MAPKTERQCPQCEPGRLVIKTNRINGSHFWSCNQWPACEYAEPLREFDRMKALGHPELPLVFPQEEEK